MAEGRHAACGPGWLLPDTATAVASEDATRILYNIFLLPINHLHMPAQPEPSARADPIAAASPRDHGSSARAQSARNRPMSEGGFAGPFIAIQDALLWAPAWAVGPP